MELLKRAILEGDIASALEVEGETKNKISDEDLLELAENAVRNGKFLSAIRAYKRLYKESWEEKVIDKGFIDEGTNLLASGDIKNAANKYFNASNLFDPMKLLQYKGQELHKNCEYNRNIPCFLQVEDIDRIIDLIFEQLFGHEKIIEILKKQSHDVRIKMLNEFVNEQDPKLVDFLRVFNDVISNLKKTDKYILSIRELDDNERSMKKDLIRYEFTLKEIEDFQDIGYLETEQTKEGKVNFDRSKVKENIDFLLKKVGVTNDVTEAIEEAFQDKQQKKDNKNSQEIDKETDVKADFEKILNEIKKDSENRIWVKSCELVKSICSKYEDEFQKVSKEIAELMKDNQENKKDESERNLEAGKKRVVKVQNIIKEKKEEEFPQYKDYISKVKDSFVAPLDKFIINSMTRFLQEVTKIMKTSLLSCLREEYFYPQRLLLGRRTGSDAAWQYLRELSTKHPIAIFLVCPDPHNFLKYQQYFDNDIAEEIIKILKGKKMILPVIRKNGFTLTKLLEIE